MRHQVDAIRAAEKSPPMEDNVFAFLMEMGTGKSKVVLDEWGQMTVSGGPRTLVVIGPKGSYRNWYQDKGDAQLSEMRTHLDPDLLDRTAVLGWRSGGGKEYREEVRRWLGHRDERMRRALFVNVEALSTDTGAAELMRQAMEQDFCYVAVDESTKIKGDSRRTNRIIELTRESSHRRILTGLVAPRSPLDLYYQFSFLDPKILKYSSFYPFQYRYAITRRQQFKGNSRKTIMVLGYQNEEELAEKIAPFSFRALKKDCLDLAPKTFTSRSVEHTPEQARMYIELKKYASTKISGDKHMTALHKMTMMMRLHQINLGHVTDDEDRVVHDIPSNRIDALLDLLEEHEGTRGNKGEEDFERQTVAGKTIIWCPYRRPLEKIVQTLTREYGPRSVAQFHGGNAGTRDAEEQRFKNDPACRFIAATQGAGMMGNNWIEADLVVYFANDHDLEHREQSEDRAHRKGQTRRVTYVDLITEGTVDVKIVKCLRAKINMATTLMGDGYKDWLI
jgi:SNF2 family DNA or RNA helicase